MRILYYCKSCGNNTVEYCDFAQPYYCSCGCKAYHLGLLFPVDISDLSADGRDKISKFWFIFFKHMDELKNEFSGTQFILERGYRYYSNCHK